MALFPVCRGRMIVRVHPAPLAACLLFFLSSGLASVRVAPPDKKNGAARRPDACALLTAKDISMVQGEVVSSVKGSEPERRSFAVSQCFYTLPTFSRSISLELTRKDPDRPGARSPRDDWMRLFHGSAAGEEREGTGGEKAGKPAPVPGVGDEAFWTSDGVGGALYVLKGDAYLRISIGGPDEPAAKIQKSKTLALKALARL